MNKIISMAIPVSCVGIAVWWASGKYAELKEELRRLRKNVEQLSSFQILEEKKIATEKERCSEDSRHSLEEESVGTGRTDTKGSLVNEVAWPKILPEPPVTKNTGKAESGSFQQPCQATYGQPSSLNQQARLSTPASAASRPSPATSHYAPLPICRIYSGCITTKLPRRIHSGGSI